MHTTKGTQEYTVYNHLIQVGTISGREAADLYRVRDLPKRISVLRSRGTAIVGKFKKDVLGQRYMRYALKLNAELLDA